MPGLYIGGHDLRTQAKLVRNQCRPGRYNRGMATSAAAKIGLDVRLTYYTGGGIARYIRHLASDLPGLDSSLAFMHFYRRGQAESFSTQARHVDCWTPSHNRLERW